MPVETPLGSDLLHAMRLLCLRCHGKNWVKDWEFTLWRAVEQGQRSFQLNRIAGMERDDVVAIRRLYRSENRWFMMSNRAAAPIDLDQWRRIYAGRA